MRCCREIRSLPNLVDVCSSKGRGVVETNIRFREGTDARQDLTAINFAIDRARVPGNNAVAYLKFAFLSMCAAEGPVQINAVGHNRHGEEAIADAPLLRLASNDTTRAFLCSVPGGGFRRGLPAIRGA